MRDRLGDLVDRYRTVIEDQNEELDSDAMEEALQNLMSALSESSEPTDFAMAPSPIPSPPASTDNMTDLTVPGTEDVTPPTVSPPQPTDSNTSSFGNGGYVLILLIVTLTLVMVHLYWDRGLPAQAAREKGKAGLSGENLPQTAQVNDRHAV